MASYIHAGALGGAWLSAGGRLKHMWPFNPKSDYDAILRKHIDGDFSLFACGKDAPSESILRDFEQEIGFSLPDDFRSFSKSPLGGVYIDVKEKIWPRAKQYAVGPFWSFLYGMFVFGFAKDIPDWMDIRVHTRQFRENTQTALVPFLKVLGDADVYCFDEYGAAHRWDHETGDAPLIQKTFPEVFAHEVEELRKRKDRKKTEQGGASNAGLAGDPPASVT
jgi:hypothetical protein